MQRQVVTFVIAIAATGIAGAAAAQPPAFVADAVANSADRVPGVIADLLADRLVGVYDNGGMARKCGTTLPLMPVGAGTLAFHSGGTLTESPRFPPAGVNNAFGIQGLFTRTIGLGDWSYNLRTRTYTMSLRFDCFIDGMFRGTGSVARDLTLDREGNTATGPLHATIYNADGSVYLELCGDATSTRM